MKNAFKHACCATVIGLACLSSPALAKKKAATDDIAVLKKEAITIMKAFGKSLKGELIKAKEAGGPLAAMDACKVKAPELATKASKKSGWTVARTSLKLRNTANMPDAYELAVMQGFEKKRASGEKAKKIVHAEIVEKDGVKTFRFVKAIPTNKMCLGCHGAPEGKLKEKLTQLYPADKAIGFKSGDIRGVFTLSKVLSSKAAAPMPKGSH